MRLLLITFLLLILSEGCHSYTCKDISNGFPSTDSAINQITKSTFRYTDQFLLTDTIQAHSDSLMSWIVSANYYSCDGEKGILIYRTTRGRDHLRFDIPIEIWKAFKDTSAKGIYYDRNISENGRGLRIVIQL